MKTISALLAIALVGSLSLAAHAECSSQASPPLNAPTNPQQTVAVPAPTSTPAPAVPELGS